MKYSYLALLFLFIIFSSCSKVEQVVAFNDDLEASLTKENQDIVIENRFLNVSYGNHPQQVFDIYLPQGRTMQKTKVLMVVHGGSWVNGDKSGLTDFVLELKESNPLHAIVNINYMLGSETHYAFPNQFFDIKKAIDFIKDNKREYIINPEFGLIGSSAGGHIALQYTYKYDLDNDVKFVASLGGSTNFLNPHYQDIETDLIDFLVDKEHYENTTFSLNQNFDYRKILSPIYQVSEQSSPTVLFYGNEDVIVPLSDGIILDKYLEKKHIDSSLNIFQGGHGGWNTDNYNETLHPILSDFINTYLFVSGN